MSVSMLVLIVVIVLVGLFFCWSLCVAAGRADEQTDRAMQARRQKR